jgi:hypothetical protein
MRTTFFSLFFCLVSTFAFAQTQVGSSINGEASGDRFGSSVDISTNGSTVAVGAWFNDGVGSNSGHARVYDLSNNNWVQFGEDIDGAFSSDLFGASIALSGDGNIVAIGAIENDGAAVSSGQVRIFQRNGFAWEQLGNTIFGTDTLTFAGISVALSEAGDVVAVGSFGYNGYRGQARAFKLVDDNWVRIGSPIRGDLPDDQVGFSLDLSADGEVLAVAGSAFGTDRPGLVRIFSQQDTGWLQVGPNLVGQVGGEGFGESVSLSADGNTVAIGVPNSDEGGADRGNVRVFSRNGESWSLLGDELDGLADADFFGTKVDLSSAGDRLVVSAPLNDGGGNNSGTVYTYEFDAGQDRWRPLGNNIQGELFSRSGLALAVAGDGNSLVIGAQFLSNDETNAGQVRVYDLSELTGIRVVTTESAEMSVFPNPASGGEVTVTVPTAYTNGTLELYSSLGQLIARQPVQQGGLATDGLVTGTYLLRVSFGGKSIRRVLVKN